MNTRATAVAAAGLPAGAELLGYAGLLPFAALAAGLFVTRDPARAHQLATALLAYGCAILSFVGAVHWGLALAARDGGGARASLRLAAAVLPASCGAVALVLPIAQGLGLEIVAFAGFWLYEHRVLGASVLPPAYLRLRRTLTLVVLAILVLALIGPIGGEAVRF